jgi:hypothetical protein
MGKGNDPNCASALSLTAQPTDEVRTAWELREQLDQATEAPSSAQALLRNQLAAAEAITGGRVFRVPSDQITTLTKAVDRAGKAAMRTGNMPPAMRVADTSVVEYEMGAGIRVGREMSFVVIAGAEHSPGEGWRFVGTLDHRKIKGELTSVIRRLPGEEATDLTRFASAESLCEHCNTRRRRNETFLVAGPDGSVRQVGRSCLADYIGSATPEKAARYAELILGLVDEATKAEASGRRWSYGKIDDPEAPTASIDSSGSSRVPGVDFGAADPLTVGTFDPEQYLAFAHASARRDGWVTRRQQYEDGKTSTATSAQSAMFSALRGEPDLLPAAEDHRLAAEALAFVRDTIAAKAPRDRSFFESRMAYIATKERVAYSDLPMLAAAVSVYERERARREVAATRPPSKHVGVAGEKYETKVKVIGKRERQTDSGFDQIIYTMEDPDGNVLTWFSSASAEMDEGKSYQLRGKVKRHGEFRGVEQTVLTGCRFSDQSETV